MEGAWDSGGSGVGQWGNNHGAVREVGWGSAVVEAPRAVVGVAEAVEESVRGSGGGGVGEWWKRRRGVVGSAWGVLKEVSGSLRNGVGRGKCGRLCRKRGKVGQVE